MPAPDAEVSAVDLARALAGTLRALEAADRIHEETGDESARRARAALSAAFDSLQRLERRLERAT